MISPTHHSSSDPDLKDLFINKGNKKSIFKMGSILVRGVTYQVEILLPKINQADLQENVKNSLDSLLTSMLEQIINNASKENKKSSEIYLQLIKNKKNDPSTKVFFANKEKVSESPPFSKTLGPFSLLSLKTLEPLMSQKARNKRLNKITTLWEAFQIIVWKLKEEINKSQDPERYIRYPICRFSKIKEANPSHAHDDSDVDVEDPSDLEHSDDENVEEPIIGSPDPLDYSDGLLVQTDDDPPLDPDEGVSFYNPDGLDGLDGLLSDSANSEERLRKDDKRGNNI